MEDKKQWHNNNITNQQKKKKTNAYLSFNPIYSWARATATNKFHEYQFQESLGEGLSDTRMWYVVCVVKRCRKAAHSHKKEHKNYYISKNFL